MQWSSSNGPVYRFFIKQYMMQQIIYQSEDLDIWRCYQKNGRSYYEHSWLSWGLPTEAVPLMWDAWSPTKIEDLHPFAPSPVAKGMYLHPQFLSDKVSAKTRDNIMAYRVPPPTKKLPVMMAAYGETSHVASGAFKSKRFAGIFHTRAWNIQMVQTCWDGLASFADLSDGFAEAGKAGMAFL